MQREALDRAAPGLSIPVRLGIPGVGFLAENKRVYPDGNEFSHIIGHVNIDNQGIAGIEKWIDNRGLADLHRAGFGVDREQEAVRLGVDVRVQHALHEELVQARDKYKADAAAGIVPDVRTGEIVSIVSVPDYNPNT
jgi:cell division protein FtsI (penicillin-binding protein 3)